MNGSLFVQVRRSGGVTGIPRAGHLEFRVRAPGPEEEPWLRVALDALEQLRGLQEAPGGHPTRDAFTWFFAFNGEEHLVPDSLLGGPARVLAEHVLRSRQRPGNNPGGAGQ